MGSNQAKSVKCTVSILNYSGIYKSPFEFYGVDNWEELEHIGKIFEAELKTQETIQGYVRDKFVWNMGDLDRQITSERYSPLYCSQQVKKYGIFPGIVDSSLLNMYQFKQAWENKRSFKDVLINKEYQSGKIQECQLFDFLCYKSIIIYLYEKSRTKNKIYIDYGKRGSKDLFQRIVKNEFSAEQNITRQQIVEAYKQFLIQYSNRMPEDKLKLTTNKFFRSDAPQIMIFTQASHQLIDQFQLKEKRKGQKQKKQGYFIFKTFGQKKNEKTLLLVKRSLPLSINENEFLQTSQLLSDRQGHLNKLSKPAKQELQEPIIYIEKIREFFSVCYRNAANNSQKVKDFYRQIQTKGLFYWTKQLGVLANFTQGNTRVLICAFYLSSHQDVNFLQIQLLGVMIYHLLMRGDKFIIAGDFNKFISLNKRDDHHGLFEFVKYVYSGNKEKLKEIDQLVKTINIYPQHSKMITSKKKRTILQTQFKKVNKLAQGCLDQILTNYPLKSQYCHISEISNIGTKIMQNQNFLPHKQHPFDHFLVEATLDLQLQPNQKLQQQHKKYP